MLWYKEWDTAKEPSTYITLQSLEVKTGEAWPPFHVDSLIFWTEGSPSPNSWEWPLTQGPPFTALGALLSHDPPR